MMSWQWGSVVCEGDKDVVEKEGKEAGVTHRLSIVH